LRMMVAERCAVYLYSRVSRSCNFSARRRGSGAGGITVSQSGRNGSLWFFGIIMVDFSYFSSLKHGS
jgi:hypothetical protein